MRAVRVTAVAALAFFIQVAFVSHIRIFGVHPDLLLLIAVAIGMTGGRNRGAIAGFVAGVCADVFMTSPLGLSALSYTIVCYAVGAFAEDAGTAPWVSSFIGALGALAGFVLLLILGAVTGEITTTVGHAFGVVLAEVICAIFITPIAVWSLRNAWESSDAGPWQPKARQW